MVKNHIVEGMMDSSHFQDEQVLSTLNSDAKLRINVYNTYPEKVVMANCAKVGCFYRKMRTLKLISLYFRSPQKTITLIMALSMWLIKL